MSLTTNMALRLVRYDRAYLDHSWLWLQDPEIRQMTMTMEFTREDQQRFFEDLPRRCDYKIWGVEIDGQPVGAAGIKHIKGLTGETWLYIGERAFWGRGFGGRILELCEEKARNLGLGRLTMMALATNRRSIRAFQKAGFVFDSVQEEVGTVRLSKSLEI